MPTKAQLIKENAKLNNENNKLAFFGNKQSNFIQVLGLEDIFLQSLDTNTIQIEDVKTIVNAIKCCECNNNCCDQKEIKV